MTDLANPPVRVLYFYRILSGFQEEFEELFAKNHFKVLKAQIETGRFLAVDSFVPRFAGDGRSGATLVVELTYRDWAALAERSEQPLIAKRMFPDQVTYEHEEERRHQLIEAAWDVVLAPKPL
jgi:hypothetical protein